MKYVALYDIFYLNYIDLTNNEFWTIFVNKGGSFLFQEDWIMRQVEGIIKTLAKILLNKDVIDYEVTINKSISAADNLHLKLADLVNNGKINEAENILFEEIDINDKRYLELALDFYSKLNRLDENSLENSGFSRNEIEEGLKDVASIFGAPIV